MQYGAPVWLLRVKDVPGSSDAHPVTGFADIHALAGVFYARNLRGLP